MKKYRSIVKIAILALVFLLLANPGWIPFYSDGVKNAISAELENTFGVFLGGSTGALAPAKLVTAAAAAVLVYLLTVAVNMLLEQIARKKKRGQAISILLCSLVKTVGAVAGIVWVLSILGVNLGAIFASLGIASLVIGFGVQSLIEDCVTGIFIILEGTYQPGDIIVLDDFRGTVRKITMRTTTIEDDGGNLKTINNSDIRNVQNRSSAYSMALSNLSISYDADLRKVEQILKDALPDIYERNRDVFMEMPVYAGVQEMGASAVVLRFWVHTNESTVFPATRRLNRELKLLMDDNGLEIPFNQLVLHNAE